MAITTGYYWAKVLNDHLQPDLQIVEVFDREEEIDLPSQGRLAVYRCGSEIDYELSNFVFHERIKPPQ